MLVPIAEHDAPRGAAVEFKVMHGGAMGVAVYQLAHAVFAHQRVYRRLIDIHDRLGLLAGVFAAGVAELARRGDALFDGHSEELALGFGIAHMGAELLILDVIGAEYVAVQQQAGFAIELDQRGFADELAAAEFFKART